ncbi:hypothetical protein D9C73_010021 [Collichthys lucidus]|uniref:Uncharacterized protein n=1 Tax=Collichthys lucidus TaxID=240159 RepID=A0A4U5UMY3_COLLU|nr:hypothetical protein D9C73_010021 [Collichthys lucidus]
MNQSTPHQLINYAMDFHMPSCIKNMVHRTQMCFALQDFTTGCQQLEANRIERKRDGGGGGDKDGGGALQDQGHVAGPTRKLDNLGGSCQPGLGSEECCTLCNTNLQQILLGCRIVRKLAEVLERRQQGSNGLPPAGNHSFVMKVAWSTKAKSVLLIELTIPAEESIEAAFEQKKAKYSELAAECQMAGWKTTIYPVEVGCRGYVGLSTTRLLRDAGVPGGNLKKATKELAEEAAKGSFWLWLRRKDRYW